MSQTRTVLDTSVLVSGHRPDLAGTVAISAVSLAELHFGVLVARSSAERSLRLERLSLIEHAFDALPVDHAVARSYGRLAAAVVEAGRQPRRRSMDILIAATAHAHGARLATMNPADVMGIAPYVEVVAL